jgi:5-formyltetrahydrofolate cyclo-ligase
MPPLFLFPYDNNGAVIDTLQQERDQLRLLSLKRRNCIPTAEQERNSALITEQLLALPVFEQNQVFFVYCSYRSEVATSNLLSRCLEAGKTTSVPLCQPKQAHMLAVIINDLTRDLACGYRTIPEPLPSHAPEQILPPSLVEVAVIPGVVFDRCGHRLGYGGGYYDRFLARSAPQAFRVGLAYSCQVVNRIPALPHDVPMDLVITEQEVLSWPRSFNATNRSL